MILSEIEDTVRTLSRSEKFHLIQFIAADLAQEEQDVSHYFRPGTRHGFWSQHNAFEAAQKLQMLLDENKS